MTTLKAYFLRCLFSVAALAGTLAFIYRDKAPALNDNLPVAYVSVIIILTLCACCGWALRVRPTRLREFFSAGLIAGVIASGLIALSDWNQADGFLGLQYFYDNGYLLAFQLTAPIATAIITILGCLIPDDSDLD